MVGRSIPEKLHEIVLSLAGNGKSNRAIAAALGKDHGCEVSHVTVGKLLKNLRAERADIAKAVVREQLAPTLTADVRRLERLVVLAMNRIYGRDGMKPDDDAFCRLAEQARKLIDTKLKYSGAGDEGPTLDADLSKLTEADLERVAAGDFSPLAGRSAA